MCSDFDIPYLLTAMGITMNQRLSKFVAELYADGIAYDQRNRTDFSSTAISRPPAPIC